MVRQGGISATRPIFPSYLLPTFKIPFARRRSSASTAQSVSSSLGANDPELSSAATTPENSPPKHGILDGAPRRLSRVAPDTLRCLCCSSDIAFTSQIISKGFTGRHGRAFLVAPTTAAAHGTSEIEDGPSLLNLRIGRSENRQLVTGWHVVADISCNTCSTKLGWKYVDAQDKSQKYKVGKFILETERVVTFSNWENSAIPANTGRAGYDRTEEESDGDDDVAFDSDDEDECDEIFAGTWDAEAVAARRARMMAQTRPVEEV